MSRDREVYGVDDIEAFVLDVKESITYRTCGMPMVVMSLLSDAQEELAMGMDERARQTVNRAKRLLHDLMEKGEQHGN